MDFGRKFEPPPPPLVHEVYVAIDIETTGQFMTKNTIAAIGAVALDASDGALLDHLLLKVDTRGSEWEEVCVQEFWSKHRAMLEFLTTATGVGADVLHERGDAVRRLFVWLDMWRKRATKLVLLSDFPQFDAGWINHALSAAGLPPLYKPDADGGWQDVLDTNAFYRGLVFAAKAAGIRKLPHINVQDLPYTHNPCDDARLIGVRHVRTRKAFAACFAAHLAETAARGAGVGIAVADPKDVALVADLDSFADIGATFDDLNGQQM